MATKKPTPEEVVQQLRDVRDQIVDEVTPMTPAQRRDLRDRTKRTRQSIVSAVSAIGMSEKVSTVIGKSPADVNDLINATDRWSAVEDDLMAFLNGISSANLMRKYQLGLIADQVFAVTKQLIRSPENAHLRTIFNDMKRLRNLERAKKRTPKSQDPPATPEGAAEEA